MVQTAVAQLKTCCQRFLRSVHADFPHVSVHAVFSRTSIHTAISRTFADPGLSSIPGQLAHPLPGLNRLIIEQRKAVHNAPFKLRLFFLILNIIPGTFQFLVVALHLLVHGFHKNRTQIPFFTHRDLTQSLVEPGNLTHRLQNLPPLLQITFPVCKPVLQHIPGAIITQRYQTAFCCGYIIINPDQPAFGDLSQNLSLKFQAFQRSPVFF